MEIKNILRLDHDYEKLKGQRNAILVGMVRLHLNPEDLDLKLYDGEYRNGKGEMLCDEEVDGVFIQLIFVGDKGIPFGVLREYRKAKWEFYNERIGSEFCFEIRKGRR